MGIPVNTIKTVKLITIAYFITALTVSFLHLIHAAGKTGLTGWEMYLVPFLIDGVAITGLLMRREEFADDTRKWGLITQCGAGMLSLVGNVYAAESVGGMMLGVAVVLLFLYMEFLGGKIKGQAEIAAAEAAKIAAEAAQAKRDKANAQARARRQAKRAPVRKLKAV